MAAVAAVQRATLSPGWVRLAPGYEPTSYTDEGGAPLETAFKGYVSLLSASEVETSGVKDERRLYRLVADIRDLKPDEEVRHHPTNRLFAVLALESPPTGNYGMVSAVVAEIP